MVLFTLRIVADASWPGVSVGGAEGVFQVEHSDTAWRWRAGRRNIASRVRFVVWTVPTHCTGEACTRATLFPRVPPGPLLVQTANESLLLKLNPSFSHSCIDGFGLVLNDG